jgi:hypothetical protein
VSNEKRCLVNCGCLLFAEWTGRVASAAVLLQAIGCWSMHQSLCRFEFATICSAREYRPSVQEPCFTPTQSNHFVRPNLELGVRDAVAKCRVIDSQLSINLIGRRVKDAFAARLASGRTVRKSVQHVRHCTSAYVRRFCHNCTPAYTDVHTDVCGADVSGVEDASMIVILED